jgi:hypothetical protein
MMRRVKLYKWIDPGTEAHKAMVHAYYHLMHFERAERFVALARATNSPDDITQYWKEDSAMHWLAFIHATEGLDNLWVSYLDDRQWENLEKRMHIMTRPHSPEEQARREKKASVKKRQFERRNKARYN